MWSESIGRTSSLALGPTHGDIAYLVEERPADAEVVTFAASVDKAVAAMADVRTRCRVPVDDDVLLARSRFRGHT